MPKGSLPRSDEGPISLIHPTIERLASLGELMSEIAHELNNPLTVILGYAEILQRADLDPSVRGHVEQMHLAALRSAKIVEGLLTFVRKGKASFSAVDVNETIRETLSLLELMLRSRQITVTTDLSPNVPPVRGDSHKLQQVFFNIILNAIQAIETWAHERLISVSSTYHGRTVKVTISDTGPGIKNEHAESVFKPFFSTKPAGTGLGLSISYGIMKEHGGEIFLISGEGRGCSFIIELPVSTEATPQATVSPKREEGLGKRVLLVDDDALVIDAIGSILKVMGCEVTLTTDATAALELLKREVFDLVLVDYRMPEMNGLDFIAQASPYVENNKFVLITGDISLSPESITERYQVRVLNKPISIQDFKKVILGERR